MKHGRSFCNPSSGAFFRISCCGTSSPISSISACILRLAHFHSIYKDSTRKIMHNLFHSTSQVGNYELMPNRSFQKCCSGIRAIPICMLVIYWVLRDDVSFKCATLTRRIMYSRTLSSKMASLVTSLFQSHPLSSASVVGTVNLACKYCRQPFLKHKICQLHAWSISNAR